MSGALGISKGPWIYSPPTRWTPSRVIVTGALGNLIYDAPLTMETQANARLIAEAPDLLAACEAVHHQLAYGEAGEGDRADVAWCANLLRGAIAKARNEPTYAGRGSSDTATPNVSTGEPTATSAAAPATSHAAEESGR